MSSLESQVVASSVESDRSMASATKGAGDEGMTELFKLNQVYYRMPPTLSLVSKRTITRCNFQLAGYQPPLNQRIASVIFNSGEFQISGRTSYLVIQVGIDKSSPALPFFQQGYGVLGTQPNASLARSTCHALLGQGGIMNIFDEITFTSASGTEVDRQQNKGLLSSHVQRNRMSRQWFDTIGELSGCPGGTFQECYDGKGFPGTITGGNAGTAPFVQPIRGIGNTPDLSKPTLGLLTNQAFGLAANGSVYDSNRGNPSLINPAVGSVDVSFDPFVDATANPIASQAPYFIVPLSDILGMFNPYMNALIPSHMLAGGRMEFRFKNMTEALVATGAAYNMTQGVITSPQSITNANAFLNQLQIYDIYLLLDSYQMNDSVLRKLNDIAMTKEGLSVMFDTWDWTQTQTTMLSFEAQVAQARSRILRSFCVIRDQACLSHPFANSLAAEAATQRPWSGAAPTKGYVNATAAFQWAQLVNSYQAILGSLYFPQQPLIHLEEQVMNANYVWCKGYCNSTDNNPISQSEFIGGQGVAMYVGNPAVPQSPIVSVTAAASYTDLSRTWGGNAASNAPFTMLWANNWGSATFGFLAERSQLLQLTGLPVSNARLLRHRFIVNYRENSMTGRFIDVFTEYTRVAKVYLGGRIVMRE